MKTDATFIGFVRRVNGVKLFIVIPDEVSLNSRKIGEREYQVAQVGSYIRIPLQYIDLFGIVSSIGAHENVYHDASDVPKNRANRWLEVQLVGETDRKGNFFRGISILPTLDHEVHIATLDDLGPVFYAPADGNHIEIGSHVAAQSLPVNVDLDKLVTRHGIIVGSTGSGKSNAVAMLLRAIGCSQFPNAQVVVIDPHGEYSAAMKDYARVFSIRDKDFPLFVPYWALSFDELAWFLVERNSATESQQDKLLREKIYEEKRKTCGSLKAGEVDELQLTPDSPVPFDLKKVWFDLYHQEHATFLERDNFKKIAYKINFAGAPLKGDRANVIPPEFEPASSGNTPPYASPTKLGLSVYLNKIFLRLKDHSFDFLLDPGDYDGVKRDLSDLLETWLGHDKPITIFNLEGIPFQVIDLVVGAISKVLFQSMLWGRDLPGLGRQRPLLVIYEEAHAYLSQAKDLPFIVGYSRNAVRRIFKEGRKYGIGAIVVSQRPSELEQTILAEAGTYFALRLSNEEDQSLISSALPEGLSGLVNLLPGLRIGEAIVVGESVKIPSRVRLPLIEPRPNSQDAEPAKKWREHRTQKPSYQDAITFWRKQKMMENQPAKKNDWYRQAG